MKIGYVNVFVKDFARSVPFFRDVLGLTLNFREDNFGYASFDGGPISFALAQTDQPDLVGRHTGVGFVVADIDAVYEALRTKGVVFDMPPTKQPWGGTLALFRDPDGNIFYLDPGQH
jgi:lactoylglutathione lyase